MNASDAEHTPVFLLKTSQEYLRCQLQHREPESLLVAAWEQFYRIYDGLIRRFAVAQGLRGADADDCVQAVWLAAARGLVDFQHPGDRPGLRAWFYTLVRSKAADIVRSKSRHVAESLDPENPTPPGLACPDADPKRILEAAWERAALETVVEDLRREVSQTNARLLSLRLLEGRPVAEVAIELGLTAEQVWYRQHRLLKKLRARMSLYTGKALGELDDISL